MTPPRIATALRRWVDSGVRETPAGVGEGRALDLVLTGRAVGASEALAR